jgi:hypothetical protein
MRPWRRRKETLGIFSFYAKRYKSVYISVNNNTNLNLFKILSNYIIWDRLSQKTISRYCPFKGIPRGVRCKIVKSTLFTSTVPLLDHSCYSCTEPIFVDLLRSPGIDFQPAGQYGNPICRTGPPGYIGRRNRFFGINSWAP